MSSALSPCWTDSRQLPHPQPNVQAFKSTLGANPFPCKCLFFPQPRQAFSTVRTTDPSVSSTISLIKLKINLFSTLPWYSFRGLISCRGEEVEGGAAAPVKQHSFCVNMSLQILFSLCFLSVSDSVFESGSINRLKLETFFHFQDMRHKD